MNLILACNGDNVITLGEIESLSSHTRVKLLRCLGVSIHREQFCIIDNL